MPSSDSAAAANAQGAKPSVQEPAQSSTAIPEVSNSDILRAAGVAEEVVKSFESLEAQPATEEEPAAATAEKEVAEQDQQELPVSEDEPPEKDADTGEPEPAAKDDQEPTSETEGSEPGEDKAAEPEGEEDTSEEPPEGGKPTWYQKRLAKWSRQKDRLQDEIDSLKDQLERKDKNESSTAATPSPYIKIDNLADLEQTVRMQRRVRDWCLENPDGLVVNEGKENEKVITPEEVRQTLIGATRILEDAPRKAAEIQQGEQMRNIAQQEWPDLYKPGTEIYQTSQAFLSQYPAIAENPMRDFILGLMVEGWKPFQARMQARLNGQQKQAPETAEAKNGEKKETLPEALRRKIPPIPKTSAPNTPRGTRARSPINDAAAAVDRLVQEGGSPESVQNAIAAIERQNAALGSAKRTAAPV